MIEEDNNILEEDSDKEEIVATSKARAASYGADYTLSSLSELVNNEDIIVQPIFQRRFVWDKNKASKLIESFLLGYPVPNILLGQVQGTNAMEVIDGQQRVTVICDYLNGIYNKRAVFKLSGDIVEEYKDKGFSDLCEGDQRKLKNAVLKATVLIYPKDNPDLKFSAFQRINTGSVVLTQQEIRNCIYYGPLNDFLHDLNKEPKWRKFVSPMPDKRMKDEETLLRYFASLYGEDRYQGSLTKFLNEFMLANQNISEKQIAEWKRDFDETLSIIDEQLVSGFGRMKTSPFSSTPGSKILNRAVFESIMVAITRALRGGRSDFSELADRHKMLMSDGEYISYCTQRTSSEKNYRGRFKRAKTILG